MAHRAPVDQEKQLFVRSVFEWRIFHRKKKRHDHSS